MNKPEEWRTSPSRPAYEVSSLGRVRSPRRVLKPFWYRGHLCVAIRYPRRQAVPVGSLVAEAFLGFTPEQLKTDRRIIYRNGDPMDCRLANLLVVPRRHSDWLDLQRASELRDDGVTLRMIEKIAYVKPGRLARYRRRQGYAARRRPEPYERRIDRELETWRELLGVSRRKADGACGAIGGDDGPCGSSGRHSM